MGSCAAPSAKGDDKFITTDYLQQCPGATHNLVARRFPAHHDSKEGPCVSTLPASKPRRRAGCHR
ncbi:hypothetical protein DZC28_25645 [Escherichia coli]|uniref:hypothetical protein n=1 Tax=Escherichia coli TaxID=562 RepID=UPI00098BF95C|nr:hypothetical protein [Escherichia coli]KAA1323675.1 hypothetical protein F1E19_24580 [Escherichia coli]OXK32230.1 hypothetical protein CDL40_26390 [Escherichia coli]QRF49875.1 hypothetical protein BW707_29075 [Escherichia coli]RFM51914.1 hypothetical protein DZC28_25645 [Escherichia coli]RFM53872.1 hypothetical protein DZC26_25535 [Escherichia coli]